VIRLPAVCALGVLAVVLAFALGAPRRARAHATTNPVRAENLHRGSRAWRIRLLPPHTLEGYASEVSVAPGSVLHLHVSVAAGRYRVRVFRIGWYGGAGGRSMRCCGRPHAGAALAIPRPDPSTGLLALRWPVTDTVRVGRDWVSGYYVANLVLAAGPLAGRGTSIPFVVRSAGRRAAILVQAAVNTWQAYNRWGGAGLYENHTGVGDDHVSFDRPYSQRGAPREGGREANLPEAWEFPLVRFLERYGYDVAYTTDVDTDRDPSELLRHRLVMTAGHDEYWTKAMRDGFESARAAGVNLAFMGANTGYWQMRYEDGRRTIVEYRSAERDPEADPALKTVRFRDLAKPRPECTLMGVQWGEIGNADYSPVGAAITPPDPWFAGTGFRPTDVLRGIVGYEYDTIFDSCPTPPLTRLFGASLPNHASPSAVRYTASSGARVFSSGSIRFAVALDPLNGRGDPRLQRFMRNALADLTR
jgi:N,N-dimethylformamidase beta subunit-like, C-terminal